MPAAAKHPHLEQPSEDAIRQALADHAQDVQDAALALHALVVETLPDARTSMGLTDGMVRYGARQYGYDGWGAVVVSAHQKWASLTFLAGTALPDPAGLLDGAGKRLRHLRVRSVAELAGHRDAVAALLKAATTE